MIAPAIPTLIQITRNLAQTALAQELKNPYVQAALVPLTEFVIENVMQTFSPPQQPSEQAAPLPETTPQCPSPEETLNDPDLLKLFKQYDGYLAKQKQAGQTN